MRILYALLIVCAVLAYFSQPSQALNSRLREITEAAEAENEYYDEPADMSALEAEAEAENELDADAEADAAADALVASEAGVQTEVDQSTNVEQEVSADEEASENRLDVEGEGSMIEAVPAGAPKSYKKGDDIARMPPTWPPVFNPPLLSAPKGSVPKDTVAWSKAHTVEYPPSDFQYDNFEVDQAALDIIDDPVTVKYREDREEFTRFNKLMVSTDHLEKRAARLLEATNSVKTPTIHQIRMDDELTVP